MQRILSHFRTLGWKLTLSYTLVTVAALLVVEILIFGGVFYFLLKTPAIPRMASEVFVASAPQAYPYLDSDPPDLNGLRSWLERVAVDGFSASTGSGGSMSFDVASFSRGEAHIAILDPDQKILAVTPATPDQPLGVRYSMSETPQLQPLFDAALQGTEDYLKLFTTTDRQDLLMAAPIFDPTGEVRAVMLFNGSMIPNDLPFSDLFVFIGGSVLVFTLAAGAIGTVFGFLTSRGFSRRLAAVSDAADSWSRGEFSAFVQDPSGDEIGQLSRRLNRMAEQLQNLLQTRQELATLEERNRLARELHDSVKQQVFATSMQIGAARALLARDPQAAEARLVEAESLARQAQTELTLLIRELHPATLQGRGLADALKEQLESWSRQTEISADLQLQGERPLPLEVEQVIFRIAQEALANIARHSQASRASVQLAWNSERFHMTISDDGRGFDPQAIENRDLVRGFGLSSMRERIEAIGGALQISSAPGQGAHITAVVDLTRSEERTQSNP